MNRYEYPLNWGQRIAIAIAGATLLSINGCAVSQFTANTTASATKDGFNYSSNKNQENLAATGDYDPVTGKMHFEVKTTASTPEAAIAAALQSNLETQRQIGELLKVILPMAAKGAGAAAGIPIP